VTENERLCRENPTALFSKNTFKSAEVAAQYFGEIERALIAGGWREVSRFRL